MIRFVVTSCAAIAMLAACATSTEMSSPPPGTPVPVVRLRAQPYSFTSSSGFDQPARLVVRDEATWQAVWAQVFARQRPVPSIPTVDFSREMIVVVAQGTHSTGGYGILIDGASESDAGLSIAVRSVRPGAKCVVTEAFTQPVDIARVPLRGGAVKFVETDQVTDCG